MCYVADDAVGTTVVGQESCFSLSAACVCTDSTDSTDSIDSTDSTDSTDITALHCTALHCTALHYTAQ